jgi:tetratricopeptide (TPR) repeat protein
MNKRRRRPNPWLIAFLLLAIGFFVYLNIYVIPTVPAPFVPTPTATRDPKSFAEDAESYMAEGQISLAMEAYTEAIKADPQDVSNYLNLAKLQLYRGEYEAARVNAENALLLDKTRPQGFTMLAWSKAFMGEYLEAEADIAAALDLDPNNAFAHAIYAYIMAMRVADDVAELDTLDIAIDESNRAISLDPNLMEAHWARGYVLEITANYEEAIQELEAAVALNGDIAELHLALGRNYLAAEEYDQSVYEFTNATRLNPTDPDPYWYISRVYGLIGERAKAVQFAEDAVSVAPTDPFMQGNLGTMYYRDLQYNQALEALELAVRGGITEDGDVVEGLPLDYSMTITGFYSRYGLALARVDRCSDAVQVAQAMLQTVPDDETSVFNANEMIRICQENQENPPTATPTPEEGATEAEPTPTPTPTDEMGG